MIKTLIKYLLIVLLISVLIYYFYPGKKLDNSTEIDKIVVLKSKRKLLVYSNGEVLKGYRISLGKQPKGKKQFEGDMKTPEGIYTIDSKNPQSGYYLNLGVSYPNEEDIAYAKSKGKSPGGLIKIHGIKNGLGFIGKFHRLIDWTHGCIALTNREVKELFEHVQIGTVIEILE